MTACLAVLLALVTLYPAAFAADDSEPIARPLLKSAGAPQIGMVANERQSKPLCIQIPLPSAYILAAVPSSVGAVLRPLERDARSQVVIQPNGIRAPPNTLQFS